MANVVTLTREGPILIITLDDPTSRNALTGNTAVDEIVAATEMIARDTSIRVAIVTAKGPAFSSGGNVKDMLRFTTDEVSGTEIRQWYLNGIQRLTRAMHACEVPMIAAVNGAAAGAGFDLTCMCDIRIASENATFAESFVRIGIIPGDGGAWLLPRVVGLSKAMEMAFTGEALNAAEALACGLVSCVVPPDALLDTALELARKIAKNPGHALRMTKRLIREGQTNTLDSVLNTSAALQSVAHKSPQHREAVLAFIEKRPPNFMD
ncbi:MAG: crotonase/enoyl-CoA hydratase family protein [Proteobacteria bacterium]|nr:crotonase/enoyl-CoA hydratase family protein [Pseudomonadota bacterium]